jgi:hypothetical protein
MVLPQKHELSVLHSEDDFLVVYSRQAWPDGKVFKSAIEVHPPICRLVLKTQRPSVLIRQEDRGMGISHTYIDLPTFEVGLTAPAYWALLEPTIWNAVWDKTGQPSLDGDEAREKFVTTATRATNDFLRDLGCGNAVVTIGTLPIKGTTRVDCIAVVDEEFSLDRQTLSWKTESELDELQKQTHIDRPIVIVEDIQHAAQVLADHRIS